MELPAYPVYPFSTYRVVQPLSCWITSGLQTFITSLSSFQNFLNYNSNFLLLLSPFPPRKYWNYACISILYFFYCILFIHLRFFLSIQHCTYFSTYVSIYISMYLYTGCSLNIVFFPRCFNMHDMGCSCSEYRKMLFFIYIYGYIL